MTFAPRRGALARLCGCVVDVDGITTRSLHGHSDCNVVGMPLNTATAPRRARSASVLDTLVSRFAALEVAIADKADDFFTATTVAHARGSALWLRDRCNARGIEMDGSRLPTGAKLLDHERDVVTRLARVATDAGDAILAGFCRSWLARR